MTSWPALISTQARRVRWCRSTALSRDNMVTGWYDAEDVAEAATEAVEMGDVSGLDEHGMIVF